MNNNNNNRVEILDGLRVIAIIIVMIYHYYNRFDGIIYTYVVHPPAIFALGDMGVELFFIISGFVITLTLTKCNSFFEFIKKRFIRLIPGMIICSTITFLFLMTFDTQKLLLENNGISDWIISNLFISPDLINYIFHIKSAYIDGAYWSLWVELQFYILGGFLYFLSPKNFFRNYIIFAIIFLPISYLFFSNTGLQLLNGGYINSQYYLPLHDFFEIFQLFKFNLWFLIGIIVNKIYFEEKNKKQTLILLFIFGLQIILLHDSLKASFSLIIFSIFLLFLYYQKAISFLANKNLSKIGIASYSIYLIHQNIGVIIINKLSAYFGNYNWIIPIILLSLFIAFGLISYKYLENPFGKNLKNLFFKQKPSVILLNIPEYVNPSIPVLNENVNSIPDIYSQTIQKDPNTTLPEDRII